MGATVRIDQERFGRLLRRRGERAYQKVAEKTERIAEIAERLAPGSMGRYVTWEVEETSRGLRGVVACNHPAVLYTLLGTAPHLIRPRRKSVLRFEVGGRVVYTKLVRHPGTKPNDFMAEALRQGRS